MNAKMTEVANVVGNFITQHYSEALLSNLFSSGLCIEDVIFHYLIYVRFQFICFSLICAHFAV